MFKNDKPLFAWTNVPWGDHPDRLDVSGTGHLEADDPQNHGHGTGTGHKKTTP